MRSVTSQTTDGLRSGRTRCPLLDDVAGPILHASPTAFVGYLNWWLIEQRRPNSCTPRPDLVLEPAREHTFVHQDLAPRNLILDSHGKLWLVDWGNAGFFPAYMEYYGIDAVRDAPFLGLESVRGQLGWVAFGGRSFVGLLLVPLVNTRNIGKLLALQDFAHSDSD